jgi:glutaredoxin
VSGAPVLLYTRTGCSHCDAMRAELAGRGAAVREINVTERPQAVAELMKLTGGRRIVPVVVEGGRVAVAPAGGSGF